MPKLVGVDYPQTAEGIQRAVDDIGDPGFGTLLLLPGNYSMNKTVTIKTNGIAVIGFGPSTRLVAEAPLGSGPDPLFLVEGELFRLERCEIHSPPPEKPLEHGSVITALASQGYVRDLRFVGSFRDGFVFNGSQPDIWRFHDVHVTGGSTWNRLFLLDSPSGGTVGSLHVSNLITSDTVTWEDAMLVLGTAVDTVQVENSEMLGMGTIVHCRATRTGQAPRWIHFQNCVLEAGMGGIGVRLDAVRDFRYGGYIASCMEGVVVGPRASQVDLSHSEFVNIGRSAITLLAGCSDVTIGHNSFEECCNEHDDQFNVIDIAAGSNGFHVLGNFFQTSNLNRPTYCVNVRSAHSNWYHIALNTFRGFRKGGLNNEGTGVNQVVWGNLE